MHRCPGQDIARWSPKDIVELACPGCGATVEFWKDDAVLTCPECNRDIRNPKADLGCAQWCPAAEQCLGKKISPDEEL